jgi:lipoprotein-anchoring transpeptidase ErfK/SrfK
VIRRLALFVLVIAALTPALRGDAAPPALIPQGVTIAGVPVGGMSNEQARAAVRPVFARVKRISYGGVSWRLRPARFGASVAIAAGVRRAFVAAPDTAVEVTPNVDDIAVRRFVTTLAKRISYPATNTEFVGIAALVPQFTEEKPGLRVLRQLTAQRIARILRSTNLTRTRVAVESVQPTLTRDNFGPVIVIRRGANELRYYEGQNLVRSFGVATGQDVYPTPTGSFSIVDMQLNPWWRPPDSSWAQGLKPIPPGPGNPLGTRWMGISAPGVGIHGTPDDASIGYSASHGCIRMHIPDAEWLFQHVHIGTPVVITDA